MPASLGDSTSVRGLVIVPAYNEEKSIEAVIRELHAAEPGLDVIVIDDGSADRTAGWPPRAAPRS